MGHQPDKYVTDSDNESDEKGDFEDQYEIITGASEATTTTTPKALLA